VLDDMIGAGANMEVGITRTAEKIRRLGHYAQMLQSHATAYFYLVVPEMMFGMDAAPEQRNLLGLIEADPALMRRVIMLRKWGQEVIKTVFGRRMHGINSVPGGVDKNLSRAECDRLLNGEEGLPSVGEVIDYAQDGLRLFHEFHEKNRSEVDRFANVPALNMSLVDAGGNVDYYHGVLRIVDENKRVVREFDYHDYLDHFSEAVEEWSYMKFPFLKELGREKGSVRVGPLARMNVTNSLSTPLAQKALERFHAYTNGVPNNMTLHTNWARTIEVLHAAELIEVLLRDPDLQKDDLIVTGGWVGEGVGVVEAPRGTLLHHYRAGPEGDITFANLIVATTHNNQVLNRTVRSVAEDYLVGRGEITEAMMNAIEVGIRAYDPCLSCATHAFGQMPLIVTVRDPAGNVINERVRSVSGT
jgi:NAD-reducing hydrogenase large subunit